MLPARGRAEALQLGLTGPPPRTLLSLPRTTPLQGSGRSRGGCELAGTQPALNGLSVSTPAPAAGSWLAAGSPDPGGVLDLDAVERAQAGVDVDLTELYRTRWAKASAREREILQFMAGQEDEVVARRDIASHLGVDTTALSMARQSLLDKGILDAPAHGMLAFTVPGFGRYVRSLTDAGGTRGS